MSRRIGAHNPRFQQTMLRIKDPKVSVPFYQQHFGMKVVHKADFPQWKFSVYFLEVPREGQAVPEPGTVESEKYALGSMMGTTLELTHNHGTEEDADFSVWNGNTGADASGDLQRAEPKFRGFGHIAFNVDDVYKSCSELEAAGVKFQKKPDEGRMKGLAFALDPDGYWIEIVKRQEGIYKVPYNLSQTMLRVKDGPASVKFYTQHLGMTVVRERHFPEWKFSLFFLASLCEEEQAEVLKVLPPGEVEAMGGRLDGSKENTATKCMWQPALELTWNHGTEADAEFKVHDGNAQPQGFGHIGFLVDDLDKVCADMEATGTQFKKKPSEGNMRGIAFAYDPDGYWVELIQRGATFSGVTSTY
eukprot:TRINITY_DN47028_c0_g1_i1.p1 TRINITY_DN47028_c0_g1~~TRINITY_DN47028_c0_g1_i1.p1  ORF type:complete len:386 (+),score=114.64 TRINITY_DN47028_c0_g1_i1:80-1159(+)